MYEAIHREIFFDLQKVSQSACVKCKFARDVGTLPILLNTVTYEF
jgi:hypothetical protein